MSESDYENTTFLVERRSEHFKRSENPDEEIYMNQEREAADALSNKETMTSGKHHTINNTHFNLNQYYTPQYLIYFLVQTPALQEAEDTEWL